MSDPRGPARPVPVPAGRLSRLTRLGGMTAGIAGNMAIGGVAQLGRGQRPRMRDLLLTPRNITRVTEQLAQMRGAAMKVGQIMSMDSGDMLPPELADIMARLRNDADFMPPAQLKQVLGAAWPEGWLKSFAKFDVRPIAAASIGQVHRATLKDGRDIAIKVQYPGVANSIDSDIKNVGALMKMSGLIPAGFDVAPYLEEARKQLHAETDYVQEAAHLNTFRRLLAEDARFTLPDHHADWSTDKVLAMSFVPGHPIEDCAALPQDQRNTIASALIDLTLREVFEFGVMQSDPNFANYRYDPDTGRIVLLDFGATHVIDPVVAAQYRDLLATGLAGDATAQENIATQIGFISDAIDPAHRAQILMMMNMAFDALRAEGPFDFAQTPLPRQMQEAGMVLADGGFVPPPVPMDVLYLQRKFAGVFLLAAKLSARIDIRMMMQAAVTP